MSKDRCFVDINTVNFRTNLKNLQKQLNETKIIGVIKANYYGHGGIELANIMLEEGVNDFCVATLSEAVKLRKQGLNGSLLILGYVEKKYWPLASKYNCILTIADYYQASQMIEFARNNNVTLEVEVKVDTGMHRIGVDPYLTDEQLQEIYACENLKVIGTYSHLCMADSFAEYGKEVTYHQKEIFDNFLARLASLGLKTGRTHLQASSGIMNYPEFKYDYVRPGFMLLGFTVGEVYEHFNRLPVLSWYSKVESLRDVWENEGISYGHLYHADKPRKIATISVGYGDGYPRCLSNAGYVVINNQKAPIVGRICMDQMMVDVSDIDVHVEDVVTLIGEGIDATTLASLANTIVDEIVCNINERVSRNYL